MNGNIIEIVVRAIDKTKSGLTSPIANAQDLATNLGKVSGALGISFTAVVTGLTMLTEKAIDAAEQINTLSQKTGLSAEKLSELEFAAQMSELSVEELEKSLRKLGVTMLKATDSSGKEAAIFRSIGVSVTDATGKLRPFDQVINDVADKFQQMPNGVTKSALAVELFGKSGTSMIPLLNEGSSGLAKMAHEAQMLGYVISSDTAKRADEFNDSMTKLHDGVEGIGRGIAQNVLPYLVDFADEMVRSVTEGGALKVVLDTIVEVATGAFKFFMALGATVSYVFQSVASTIAGVATVIAAFFDGGYKQAKAAAKAALDDQYQNTQIFMEKMRKLIYGASQENKKNPILPTPDPDDMKTFEQRLKEARHRVSEFIKELRPEFKEFFGELNKVSNEARISALGFVTDMGKALNTNLSKGIGEVLKGTKSLGDAFKDLGESMVNAIIDFVAQKAAAFVTEKAMMAAGEALLGAQVVASTLAAGAIAGAWASPAAAVSLATFGANAGPALAAITSTLASSQGLFSGAASLLGGFATGTDYVPRTGPYLMHEGERVVKQRTNKKLEEKLNNDEAIGGDGAMLVQIVLDGNVVGKALTKWQKNGQVKLVAQ